MFVQFLHLATRTVPPSSPEVLGAAVLSLRLAASAQQDSTATLLSKVGNSPVVVEWLAEQTGQLGTLVTWRGPERGMAAVLSAAFRHGIDFGHYFQHRQHVLDHEHHLDLHRWCLRYLRQDLSLEDLYRWCHSTRPNLEKMSLEQRLQTDSLTLALAWIQCSCVQGQLDLRSRAQVVDLVASAYRGLDDPVVRRHAVAQVKRFLKRARP